MINETEYNALQKEKRNAEYLAMLNKSDEANRLVYEMSDNQIIVKSCKGHYEEKKREVVKRQHLYFILEIGKLHNQMKEAR